MPDDAVPLLARPGRVALARVDDRAREVVRERRRLAAARADRAERDGRVRRRGRRVRVEGRDRRRAVERVAVGRAVELDRAADDARRPGAEPCRPGGRRSRASCPASVSPSRPASCLSGPHRDQVPAAVDPAGERRDLRGRERRLAEDDDVELREQRRRDEGDVDRRERVQALVAQDLAEVRAEAVRRSSRRRGSAAARPRS